MYKLCIIPNRTVVTYTRNHVILTNVFDNQAHVSVYKEISFDEANAIVTEENELMERGIEFGEGICIWYDEQFRYWINVIDAKYVRR